MQIVYLWGVRLRTATGPTTNLAKRDTNDLSLGLGVRHASQLAQEQLLSIHTLQVHTALVPQTAHNLPTKTKDANQGMQTSGWEPAEGEGTHIQDHTQIPPPPTMWYTSERGTARGAA